ncbi:Zn-dependent hydrolase [Pontibacillus halophilus JSM 076056 = DSM 19796]|uniref:Zn-dependent hydrolase n=1 Tax=Pontibacillus halophilus JSM 076056 = DSM 19796 TaxID=1385510 RepID=A0A0A5GML2_9BACI|nr:MBL fold metallo-hydrolase [Pontibacillus halophilus]KGX92405.1 Zn-dependent hydrolase [Pontibacillus halophilus JSM 076056 = DSM 19796]
MRVMKEKDLYQLTFMPKLFPINCYLIDEGDGLTLIDAALPSSIDGIMNTVKDIGKPITRIVITHAHNDHVGSLDLIKDQFPEATVYISRRDARLLERDFSTDKNEPSPPKKSGVPKALKTQPNETLVDGNQIGSLLAIETPGHTPGSMAFLDTRTGTLIAGDAFQNRGGFAVTGQLRLAFPFPAFATWNKHQALESAKKLSHYNPNLLAVGHGDLVRAPAKKIAEAIKEAQRNLEKK